MHSFTSFLSSIPGPRPETILAIKLFARTCSGAAARKDLKNRWLDEHTLTGETF